MSTACRVIHRWSKNHLAETYSGQLIQVRLCTRCATFDTHGVSLSSIKRDQMKELWDDYHNRPEKKKETVLISEPFIEAEAVGVTASKWVMPDWMYEFCEAGVLDDKSKVEEYLNLSPTSATDAEILFAMEYRGRVTMLTELKMRGILMVGYDGELIDTDGSTSIKKLEKHLGEAVEALEIISKEYENGGNWDHSMFVNEVLEKVGRNKQDTEPLFI